MTIYTGTINPGKPVYIGIDPGKQGGAAIIIPNDVLTFSFHNATPRDIWDFFCDSTRERGFYYSRAVLEKVHAGVWGEGKGRMMGVKSAFTFGQGFGMLEGFLVAMESAYELVTPATWQKAMGCLTKGDKNVSKKKAQQLFPNQQVTHYIADALLIAEYCRRTFE